MVNAGRISRSSHRYQPIHSSASPAYRIWRRRAKTVGGSSATNAEVEQVLLVPSAMGACRRPLRIFSAQVDVVIPEHRLMFTSLGVLQFAEYGPISEAVINRLLEFVTLHSGLAKRQSNPAPATPPILGRYGFDPGFSAQSASR